MGMEANMNCTRCGRDIETDSAFCRFCGASATVPPPPVGGRRLARRPAEGRIAGVCSGLAEYFDTDVTLVRLAWVILSIVPGCLVGGVLAYVAAWLLVPPVEGPALRRPDARRLTRSTTDRQIAGVCGGLAAYFNIDSTVMRVIWAILTIWPGAIVFGVVAYLVAWFIMPDAPATGFESAPSVA
jgi:phage shock protein C